MSTRKTPGNVASLLQQLGSAKNVLQRLGIKGLGPKRLEAAKNDQKIPTKIQKSLASKAANLLKRLPEEEKAAKNQGAAEKLGLHKPEEAEKAGLKAPTPTGPVRTIKMPHLKDLNSFFEHKVLSADDVFKIANIPHSEYRHACERRNIDQSTVRYENGLIVAYTGEIKTADKRTRKGDKMYLVKDLLPGFTPRYYWTTGDILERYKLFKNGQDKVGSDHWRKRGMLMIYDYSTMYVAETGYYTAQSKDVA